MHTDKINIQSKRQLNSMMAEKYTSELLGIVVAQIAQTIGYSRTQSAPLELLEDILQRFIQELARDLHSQAEHANRVEPNLKDAFLSLRNLNINVHELLDYIGNVEPIPFVREVPAYPVKRSSNMNFLKPGSAETLTRPVHIFEYLPPMLPTEPTAGTSTRWPDKASDQQHLQLCKLESNREAALTFSHKTAVKLLQDVKPDFVAAGIQKWSSQNDPSAIASLSRDNLDHDGHAIREISSVVMTTGGFISPAIEGKLPEAYVPDIIDKFKGLDAPSISPPAPKTPETQKYSSNDIVDVPVIKRMASLETPHCVEHAPIFNAPMTPNSFQEVNTVLKAGATSVPAPSNLKAKKNKKRNLVGGRPNDQTGDLSSKKAHEKAQRKALKIYQKLSKNQADGGGNIMELKKSMKNLNRGMLSALPDGSTERLQLEKLIRKQTKQRQKHLKSQKQQRQFPPMSKLAKGAINPIALAPESSANLEPTLVPSAHPLAASTAVAENIVGLVENKEIFQTNLALTSASTIADASLTEEIKLASEPDRNKLNIFKKISKQKAPKPVSPNPLNISTNLFESPSNNVSPLITLPSGTTITPAPPAGATENVNMKLHSLGMSVGNSMATYDYMQPFGHLSTVSPTAANLMGIDMNKPRKRGRKPGGKNQARSLAPPTGLAPVPMQSPKKTKAAKLNAYNTADPVPIIDNSATLALPMEPLNLSHVDQLRSGNFSGFLADVSAGNAAVEPNPGAFSETSLKFQKVKEKKDRKKSKAKYINMDANIVDNKKLGLMDTEKQISKNASFPAKLEIGDSNNIQIPSDKLPGGTKNRVLDVSLPLIGNSNRLVASSGPSSFPPNSAALHPNSQANMMPILPLLHFPPRPGLIPSGPGLFAPNLTSFNKTVAGSTGSNMMMPNPFMPFPSRSRPSLETTTATDNKAALLGLLPLSDIHLERSYCNVAPLVPDSMKLSNQQQIAPNKLRSPHGFAPDAKLSHEYSEKDISHTSPISNVMPVAKGVGLLGIADETQTNKIDRSIKAIKPAPAATGNVGDPIEVSDDSNDDESKATKKSQQISGYPHALKSGLIQSSNLLNSGPMQHIESSHLYAMNASALHSPIPDGILFNKQAKPAVLKVTQPDNNLSAANPTPFNINFMGNDKFSLAGGADLIPLSRVDSGMAYSSLTVPATSLAAGATSGSVPIHAASDAPEQHFIGSLNYDDVTITPTNSLSISEQLKIRKLHKKLKKPKEGKIKKKKDKKDKVRNKEKCDERNTLNIDKPKSQDKKQKRDKKKEKQVPPDELQIPKENLESGIHHSKTIALGSVGVPPGDSLPATVSQTPVTHHLVSPKLDLSPNQVPKLTLKLSGTPTQSLFEGDREISTISDLTPQTPNRTKREHSPELARFSPLVTRPPKPKQCESQTLNLSMATSALVSVPNTSKTQTMPAMMSMPSTQAPILSATSPSWMSNPPSTSTISASSVLLPQQLLHPSKQIPKMPSSSSSLSTTIASVAASSISPKLSEGSQTLPPNSELNRPSSYVDADGYRIWICPACGKVDDGSAMIGCDGCDAWYHWSCVGILVAPNDNEDWFCRVCITKKKVNGSDKKKKRTKKK